MFRNQFSTQIKNLKSIWLIQSMISSNFIKDYWILIRLFRPKLLNLLNFILKTSKCLTLNLIYSSYTKPIWSLKNTKGSFDLKISRITNQNIIQICLILNTFRFRNWNKYFYVFGWVITLFYNFSTLRECSSLWTTFYIVFSNTKRYT